MIVRIIYARPIVANDGLKICGTIALVISTRKGSAKGDNLCYGTRINRAFFVGIFSH